jgi:hypothetical protein
MKCVFLNKRAQSRLKPGSSLVVKMCSNLSSTVFMEEGCQKSIIYNTVQTTKVNCKAAAIFGADESSVWLWQKHKAVISECEASQKKFSGHKKGLFPEIDDAVFVFFQM